MITTFPLTLCCQMLAVDAKTLRSWLVAAEIESQTDPEDTRLKLLTLEQVYHLALLHRRSLRPPVANTPLPFSGSQVDPLPDEALLTRSDQLRSDQLPSDVHQLSQKLAQVEARLTAVCEQLAQLALLLAQEREQRYEQRITILEACVLAELSGQQEQFETNTVRNRGQKRQMHPADQRARTRSPALIEYASAEQRYVLLSQREGELSFAPDSPEWFDWLASLSSFRFIGQSGRFSCYREHRGSGPTRCWTAFYYFHHRTYKHYVGVTDSLTMNTLEQAAAALQALLPSV